MITTEIGDLVNKKGLKYVIYNYCLSDEFVIKNADRIDWYFMVHFHGLSKVVLERFWPELKSAVPSLVENEEYECYNHKSFMDNAKSAVRDTGLEVCNAFFAYNKYHGSYYNSQIVIDLGITTFSIQQYEPGDLKLVLINKKNHRDIRTWMITGKEYISSEDVVTKLIRSLPNIKNTLNALMKFINMKEELIINGMTLKSENQLVELRELEDRHETELDNYFNYFNNGTEY